MQTIIGLGQDKIVISILLIGAKRSILFMLPAVVLLLEAIVSSKAGGRG